MRVHFVLARRTREIVKRGFRIAHYLKRNLARWIVALGVGKPLL